MITMICGVPGAGKTSLMAYYATQVLQNDLENYISCKRELRGLNNTGFNYDLPPTKAPLLFRQHDLFACKRLPTQTKDKK